MDLTRRRFAAGATALGLTLATETWSALAAPKARNAPSGTGKRLDAIVLGAGVAGLNTAWLLEQQGLKVLVLEARQRVGGRVFTLFDQPGYPEMGFNSMAAGYGRGIDAAQRAGVELVDVAPRFRAVRQELVLGGQVLTRDEWAKSPANPFPADRKMLMPWEIVGKTVSEANPLKDWSTWLDPASAALDISLNAFLKARGLSEVAIQFANDTSPYYGTSSHDVSALMLEYSDGWVKSQFAAGPQSFAVKGGNQKLPEAMAKLLNGDLLTGKEVVGISSESDGATVVCRDGTRYRAKRIICSLPFSTLRNVRIEPRLDGPQAEAVATLPYQPLSTAFLAVKSPFWESDKLSPSMWTDGPLGTVIAQKFGRTDDEITGLTVQARGNLARYWDRLGKDATLALIVQTLEAIRPASKGQVTATALCSWAGEPFSGGDWAYFAPGQISGFVSRMAEPAGRIHFCGEHTTTSSRGLEGALESSERVALEVLSA
jgi:monoamine oxidase